MITTTTEGAVDVANLMVLPMGILAASAAVVTLVAARLFRWDTA